MGTTLAALPDHLAKGSRTMHRRSFLKSVGVLAGTIGSAGLLVACADDEPSVGADAPGTATSVIPEGEPSLNVIHASIETLAGKGQRFAFGLTTLENVALKGAAPEVFVRELDSGDITGPYPAEWHDEGGSPLGLYVARIDVPQPGVVDAVVVVGEQHGATAVQVVSAADSTVPAPGEAAVAVATPTAEEDLGVAEVCTSKPPCGMHEVSLDEALAAGRPVALMFATPGYCTSAICAPAVDTLAAVRDAGDWGDTAFIHVEIFQDEEQSQVLKAVQEWGLRSEPWFFAIDRQGSMVERIDGPMLASDLSRLAEQISAS
jgi:hypothetical protein